MGCVGFFWGCWPGLAPAGDLLSFASPKESKQRKGDPTVCVPALRFGQPAVLGPAGVSLNSLRSNNAIPDPSGPPLLGASTRGGYGEKKSKQPKTKTEHRKPQGHAMACPCLYLSWFPCLLSPLPIAPSWLGRGAQRQADQGWRCLSEASLARPRLARAPQVARSEAQGPRLRVAFSLLTFFWRSKRK